MWPFATPINLIRYLIVWRVQSSLMRLPPVLPVAISETLGALIAERLDAYRARPWQKAQAKTAGLSSEGRFSEAPWPIEASILPYPGKRTLGEGEPIAWELKLFGADADHGFFLEVILPALEAASITNDPRWKSSYSLWGNVAIAAIYVAYGRRWEPLVQDGRLNVRMTVSSTQWIDGQVHELSDSYSYRRLAWLTPFELGKMPDRPDDSQRPRERDRAPRVYVPTVQGIMLAMLNRAARALPDSRLAPEDVWQMIDPAEQAAVRATLARHNYDALREHDELERPRKGWPGQWIGSQTFARTLAPALLPYLNLAAILHVGQYTHYGCGTFRMF